MVVDGSLEHDWCSLGCVRGRRVVHHRVEAVVVVGGVLHGPDGAVSLVERVRALHDITVTALLQGLVVTGMIVSNGVRVLVFGVSLKFE